MLATFAARLGRVQSQEAWIVLQAFKKLQGSPSFAEEKSYIEISAQNFQRDVFKAIKGLLIPSS